MPHAPRRRTLNEPRVRLADRFVLTDVVSHLLRRAHFRAEELFAAEFGRLGLTPRQKALLVMAYQHPGETQNQLAERIALDRHSFAEMLKRMVGRGLLSRVRAKRDARAYTIHLTPHGTALLREILPQDAVVEARVVESIPPEYRPHFATCLKLMLGLAPSTSDTPPAPTPARPRRRPSKPRSMPSSKRQG